MIGAGLSTAEAARLKDITTIQGNRDNQLLGYGIVVGLKGTGDGTSDFTQNAIVNSLERLGIKVDRDKIKSKNAAAVIVTADIPPFVREGSRINIVVSSLGDAKTLQGGVLLQTPLRGPDNVVYAVAQGPIAVGGFLGGTSGEAGSSSVQQNHPTVGMVAGGAIVEREINTEIMENGHIDLVLRNPDFTSAVRIADVLNSAYPGSAKAESPMSVDIQVPEAFVGQEVNFVAQIGALEVTPDVAARVVVNERTGTIVATSNVRISTVAISHGSLTITIASNLDASQPGAFAPTGAATVQLPSTQTTVNEVAGGFSMIYDYPNIERLTTALNSLGVSSREMMSILQTLKRAGALQAELILN